MCGSKLQLSGDWGRLGGITKSSVAWAQPLLPKPKRAIWAEPCGRRSLFPLLCLPQPPDGCSSEPCAIFCCAGIRGGEQNPLAGGWPMQLTDSGLSREPDWACAEGGLSSPYPPICSSQCCKQPCVALSYSCQEFGVGWGEEHGPTQAPPQVQNQ